MLDKQAMKHSPELELSPLAQASLVQHFTLPPTPPIGRTSFDSEYAHIGIFSLGDTLQRLAHRVVSRYRAAGLLTGFGNKKASGLEREKQPALLVRAPRTTSSIEGRGELIMRILTRPL